MGESLSQRERPSCPSLSYFKTAGVPFACFVRSRSSTLQTYRARAYTRARARKDGLPAHITGMRTDQARHQTGAPASQGGKWKTEERATTDMDLAGDVGGIAVGSRTPWGSADVVNHLAPGIASVHTASHGGIKLSPERNAMVPAALRRRSGWYEEDCEAHIVMMTFPDDLGLNDKAAAAAVQSVKDWFPDGYEKAFGVSLGPDESFLRAAQQSKAGREAFRVAHADDHVTTGELSQSWAPPGYRVITTERRTTGETRSLLVPNSFWQDNNTNRTDIPIVVRPGVGVDVTHITERERNHESQPLPVVADLGYKTDHLTSSQAARAQKELSTRYRLQDGTVATLLEILSAEGVTSKQVTWSGTGPAYWIRVGSHVRTVSKSSYDALTGVPEQMSEGDHARLAARRADAASERLMKAIKRGSIPLSQRIDAMERLQSAQADAAAAWETVQAHSDAERAAYQARMKSLQAEAQQLLDQHTYSA